MSKVMERIDSADRRLDTMSERQEVICAIEPAVADNLRLLVPIDRAWQPTDYLPSLEAEAWREEVERFRTAAETVPDDLLVVLVGDMVTEEALPSYSMALNAYLRVTGRVDMRAVERTIHGLVVSGFNPQTQTDPYEHDPAGGILAFRAMLRGRIAMPGRFMHDASDPDLFDHFAIVAQRANVYTVFHRSTRRA